MTYGKLHRTVKYLYQFLLLLLFLVAVIVVLNVGMGDLVSLHHPQPRYMADWWAAHRQCQCRGKNTWEERVGEKRTCLRQSGRTERDPKRMGYHSYDKWRNLNLIKVGKGPTCKEHLRCHGCLKVLFH